MNIGDTCYLMYQLMKHHVVYILYNKQKSCLPPLPYHRQECSHKERLAEVERERDEDRASLTQHHQLMIQVSSDTIYCWGYSIFPINMSVDSLNCVSEYP